MKAIGKDLYRHFLTEGAARMMVVSTKEKPTKTALASTDRKGYTVETNISFLDERVTFYTEVQPWLTNVANYIARIEYVSKHKFADYLYNKGMLTPTCKPFSK